MAIFTNLQQKQNLSRQYRNFVSHAAGLPGKTTQSPSSVRLAAAADAAAAFSKEAAALAETLLSAKVNLGQCLRRRLKSRQPVPRAGEEAAPNRPLPPTAENLLEIYRLIHGLATQQEKIVAELGQQELQRSLSTESACIASQEPSSRIHRCRTRSVRG